MAISNYTTCILTGSGSDRAELPSNLLMLLGLRAVTIKPLFAWYDLWVGAFYDRKTRKLYILPLPCIGVVIQFK
jgi:hypothetical protein